VSRGLLSLREAHHSKDHSTGASLKAPVLPGLFIFMELTHLKSIGQNIRQLREYRGLSGEQLAAKIGATKSYISKIENGRLNMTIGTLVKISNALNCAMDINFVPI
ncbi:MAG TPA: helix-turn-helix transcriptional regulator, partial [Candidatus Kapabacteria bacterium]